MEIDQNELITLYQANLRDKIITVLGLFKNIEHLSLIFDLFYIYELNVVMEHASNFTVSYECKFWSDYDLEIIQNQCIMYYKNTESQDVLAVYVDRVEIKAYSANVIEADNGLIAFNNMSQIKISGAKVYNDIFSSKTYPDEFLIWLESKYTHKQTLKFSNLNQNTSPVLLNGKSLHLIFTCQIFQLPEFKIQKMLYYISRNTPVYIDTLKVSNSKSLVHKLFLTFY